MGTVIRPEISQKNENCIDKHRYYELKHFCLQYHTWKKNLSELEDVAVHLSSVEYNPSTNIPSDLTSKYAILRSHYSYCINMVENAAKVTDPELCEYILKAVTEGLSYPYLKSRLNIPCSRDVYYSRYRKFFKLLDTARK